VIHEYGFANLAANSSTLYEIALFSAIVGM
jgi:hypothetical protein